MPVYSHILIDLPKDSNDTFVSLSSPDGDVTLQTNSESSVPASIGNVDTYKILPSIILYDRIVIFEGSMYSYILGQFLIYFHSSRVWRAHTF